MRSGIQSPFAAASPFGGPGGGTPLPPLPYTFRGTADDFDGTTLHANGVDFAPASQTPPTLDGDAIVFDGSTDRLDATLSLDLDGKTFFEVWEVTAVTGTQQGVSSFRGPSSSACDTEAGNNSAFYGRIRSSGFGLTTFSDPVNPATNGQVNRIGQKALYVTRYTSGTVLRTAGPNTARRLAVSGGSRAVTSLILGRANGGLTCPAKLHELRLLESVEWSDIRRAAGELADAWGITVPFFSMLAGSTLLTFGDSIIHGINATTPGTQGFAPLSAFACLAAITRQSVSGARMSDYGVSDGAVAARCWTQASANSSYFAGEPVIWVHFGANDWDAGAIPLGDADSTADNTTLWGSMKLGLAQAQANAPNARFIMSCPPYQTSQADVNAQGWSLNDCRTAIRDFCALNGLAYIDTYTNAGIDASNWASTYQGFGAHPNTAGHAKIAETTIPQLQAILRGWE